MILIIAGSRNFNDFDFLETEVLKFLKKYKEEKDPLEIVSGNANGADKLGEKFAKKYGLKIHYKPANWKEYGKSAGMIRNKEMVDMSTHCICFWDGKSPGTKNMIDIAGKEGLIVSVIKI